MRVDWGSAGQFSLGPSHAVAIRGQLGHSSSESPTGPDVETASPLTSSGWCSGLPPCDCYPQKDTQTSYMAIQGPKTPR